MDKKNREIKSKIKKINPETKVDIINIIIFIISTIIGLTLVTLGFISFSNEEEFITPTEIDNSNR